MAFFLALGVDDPSFDASTTSGLWRYQHVDSSSTFADSEALLFIHLCCRSFVLARPRRQQRHPPPVADQAVMAA